MSQPTQVRFPGRLTFFHEKRLPEWGTPAGYCALIDGYGLVVPLPRTLYATGDRHRIVEQDGWRLLTPRHAPEPSLAGHLVFALKYEGVDLAVLKRLFMATGPCPIEALVRAAPTGSYSRRAWFLYEWLTGRGLDLPDAGGGRYVPVIDPERQFSIPGQKSRRHRVVNNLPGTPEFCPLVFRTKALDQYVALALQQRAQDFIANVPRDLLARTAAFLLLKDSKSSYAIEGERPPQDRIQRWGRAIGEAGRQSLDLAELLRLQAIVIGDARLVALGVRKVGGFVGEHDRQTHMPLPDHICARPDDLGSLISGMIAFEQGPLRQLDPIIAAAVLAFGFVYVHPFEDGNGRIHRYLIHHALAQRGFNPPGVLFPVSSAILERLDTYRRVLEDYAQRLLPLIEWASTPQYNVRVLNDTGDFYRFFDATPQAEFLYACVQATIEEDLPQEMDLLRRHDQFRERSQAIIDMPARTIDLLFRFLQQGHGRLSKRAREGEFASLTEDESEALENIYVEIFPQSEKVRS